MVDLAIRIITRHEQLHHFQCLGRDRSGKCNIACTSTMVIHAQVSYGVLCFLSTDIPQHFNFFSAFSVSLIFVVVVVVLVVITFAIYLRKRLVGRHIKY